MKQICVSSSQGKYVEQIIWLALSTESRKKGHTGTKGADSEANSKSKSYALSKLGACTKVTHMGTT